MKNKLNIIEAKFLTSAPSIKQACEEGVSEVAFLGRSNVGKSSFINSLVNMKNLAKSSSTPGKTRLINFFEIKYKKDEEIYISRFVDLPGFGYAKVSKAQHKDWQKNLTDFINKRQSIRLFVHLIDSRHPKMPIDKEVRDFLEFSKKGDQRVLEIFTKVDKLKQKEFALLKKEYPDAIFVSNFKKRGIEVANEKIFEILFSKW